MFSIFNHVMKSERDTNSEPGLPVIKAPPSFAQLIIALTTFNSHNRTERDSPSHAFGIS